MEEIDLWWFRVSVVMARASPVANGNNLLVLVQFHFGSLGYSINYRLECDGFMDFFSSN